MNKNIKKIVSMVAAFAIVAAMGLGAFSYFTDYATESVEAKAGTFDISLDQTIDLTEGLGIINPGDSNPFDFKVINEAEKSADVYAVVTVIGTPKATATSASPYMLLVKDTAHGDVAQAEVATVEKDDNTYVYTLPVQALIGTVEKDASLDGTVKEFTYEYEIGMDLYADNEWEGSDVDVKIEIFAKQHRNTDGIAQATWTQVVKDDVSTDHVDAEPANP